MLLYEVAVVVTVLLEVVGELLEPLIFNQLIVFDDIVVGSFMGAFG